MLRKLAAAIALLSGMLGNSVAYGLGLGNATLDSSLNQKLDVEIELIEVGGLTAAEILPSLATAADFKRAELQRPAFLSKLIFEVATGADNKPHIRVTSREPVVEPYLNFLLEVHWPDGRLLREYTLLLDLPSFSNDVVGPQQDPASPTSTATAAQNTAALGSDSAALGSGVPPDSSAELTSRSPSETYRVRKRDNITQIAMKTRPEGVSLSRMMAALQAENPTAFINGNINLLKQGVTLNIPDRNMLASIDEATARNSLSSQKDEWRKVGGKVHIDATPRETIAEPIRKTELGRLDIVAGGNFGEGQGASEDNHATTKALEIALAANQEKLDTLGRANTELKERLRDLNDQIGTLEKLIVLRNDQLAAAQALANPPVEEPVKEVVNVLPPSGQTPQNQSPEEIDYNFQNGTGGSTENKPAPISPPAEDVFEPSVDNDGIGLVPIVGGSAVALLTLLGGLLFLRRRQEQEIDDIYEDEDIGVHSYLDDDIPQVAKPGYPGFGSDLHRTGESAPGVMPSSAGAQPQPSQGFDYDYDDDLDDFMDDFDDQSSGGSSKPNSGHDVFEFDMDHDDRTPSSDHPGSEVGRNHDDSTPSSDHSGAEVDMDIDLSALEAELEGEVLANAASQPVTQDDDLHASSGNQAAQKESAEAEEENWDDDFSLDDLDAELMNLSNAGSDDKSNLKGSGDTDQGSADEVGTMLDLARAYMDMGDEDGARDILDEIVTDGSAAQRAEAQQLLNKLS